MNAPPVAPSPSPAEPQESSARRGATRRRGLGIVAVLVLVAAVAAVAYWALVLNHFESTDNAYVQGNVVQITPQVAGTVVAIKADDTAVVRSGQALVQLDPTDARLALDQAESQLAQTVRELRTLYANDTTLKAQVALRETEVARIRTEVQRAEDDVQRRAPLVASGAVGREEFEHAKAQLASVRAQQTTAQAAVLAAREQLTATRAQTEGVALEHHPAVQRAAARLREAWLALQRCTISAPVGGTVARRSVQLGQRVQAGAPLMAVVGLDGLWVDANFKEVQLAKLRIGQPATLEADVYGSKVSFHGTVAGLGAGTGSAFALLPAQNATGNWIKIVQRVPVRIALDPVELQAHPLRVGLSMEVKVDVARTDGPLVADSSHAHAAVQTRVFDTQDQARAADERVRQIIAAHLGRAAPR